MIELKNVSRVYKNLNNINVTALRGVNLKFAKTGLNFIVGASGSGKSTLLNIMAGLDFPTGGEMLINGVNVSELGVSGLDGYRNSVVGKIYQEFNLLDHMTMEENVELAVKIQGKQPNSAEIRALFAKLGIENLLKRYPNQCSGGQCQRVAIARVLIKKPQILVADEPTSSVDAESRVEIYKTLKELSKEILVIAATHSRLMMNMFADRIISIEGGLISSDIFASGENRASEVFGKNEVIAIEAGAQLTNADLLTINRVVAGNKKPTYLIVESDIKKVAEKSPTIAKEIEASAFDNRKKDKIASSAESRAKAKSDECTGVFQYERTKLPVRSAFALSMVNFKSNRARSIFTIVLSVLAITFYALSMNLANLNVNQITINSFARSGDPYVTISQKDALLTNQDWTRWTRKRNDTFNNYLDTSLVYDFGPGITMEAPAFTFNNTSVPTPGQLLAVNRIATIADTPTPDKPNGYGQSLVVGRWPDTAEGVNNSEIAISDFMAAQIQTAYHVFNTFSTVNANYALNFPTLRKLVGLDASPQNHNLLVLGDNAITYTIVGIYETDFRQYFETSDALPPVEATVFSVGSAVRLFDFMNDVRINSDATEQERNRISYLLQNVYNVGFVAGNFITGIQSPLNTNSALRGTATTTGFTIGASDLNVGASNIFLTTHPGGIEGNRANCFFFSSTYVDNGLTIKSNGSNVTDGRVRMNQAFKDKLGPIQNEFVFSVMKRVSSFGVTQISTDDSLQDRGIYLRNSATTFHRMDVLSYPIVIDNTLPNDTLVFNSVDYTKLVNMIVLPSSSLIVSNNYSSRVVSTILNRMGSSAVVSYSDSASIVDFTGTFTDSSDFLALASVAFGMFAVLMMYHYIYQSIRSKRKNIAIIRSLGARSRDLFRIFAIEALILAAFVTIGALGIISLSGLIMNLMITSSSGFRLNIFTFNPVLLSIVLGSTIAVILASYLVPVFLYSYRSSKRGMFDEIHTPKDN
jgi:ABC-type lipoprotein export system ATPase subunit/ABC-type antimicrobial peptide transport system permease subunit